MRKLLLSMVMSIAVFSMAIGQSDITSVMSKLEKNDKEIAHPKRSLRSSTWTKRAAIYHEIAIVNVDQIFVGQPASIMIAAIGQPNNASAVPIIKIGNEEYKQYDYDQVTIYLDANNNVSIFEEVAPAMEDAYEKAIEAYKKALEVSPKAQASVTAGYNQLVSSLLVKGNNEFALKKFEKSYVTYALAAELMDVVKDSKANDVYFQLSIAAMMSKAYDNANKNLDILIERKDYKEGNVLYYAGIVKSEIESLHDEAEKIFIQGIQEFPDNNDMLTGLINLYMKRGEDGSKIIPYIQQAQKKDPKNINLILQEGNAYVAMDDYLSAIDVYKRAVLLDPTFFNALYNEGYAYYKLADKAYKELNELDYSNVTATKAKNEEVVKYRKAAIGPLEKAYELDPKNKSVVELVRALSFTLRDSDPMYMEKYNKFNEISKTL